MEKLSDLTAQAERNHMLRGAFEYIRAMTSSSTTSSSVDLVEQRLGPRSPGAQFVKSAVGAIVAAGDPGAYLAAVVRLFEPIMAAARRQTILGQIAGLTLPANMGSWAPTEVTSPSAAWVAEGSPIPATYLSLDLEWVDITKLATILMVAQEWVNQTDDPTAQRFQRMLVGTVRELEDPTLLDDAPAVARMRPAGLLYGVSSSGAGSPSDLDDDLQSLWRSVREGEPQSPVFICSPRGAVYLATLTSGNGPMFPDVSPMGGRIWGVPQLASKAAEDKLILLDAGALIVSDLGLAIDRSTQAAVQMDTAPTAGGAAAVSAFQANLVALRLTRYVNWTLAFDDCVGFVTLPLGSPA